MKKTAAVLTVILFILSSFSSITTHITLASTTEESPIPSEKIHSWKVQLDDGRWYTNTEIIQVYQETVGDIKHFKLRIIENDDGNPSEAELTWMDVMSGVLFVLYNDENGEAAGDVSIIGFDQSGNSVELLPPVDPSEIYSNKLYQLGKSFIGDTLLRHVPFFGTICWIIEHFSSDLPKISINLPDDFKDENRYDIIEVPLVFKSDSLIHEVSVDVPLRFSGSSTVKMYLVFKAGHLNSNYVSDRVKNFDISQFEEVFAGSFAGDSIFPPTSYVITPGSRSIPGEDTHIWQYKPPFVPSFYENTETIKITQEPSTTDGIINYKIEITENIDNLPMGDWDSMDGMYGDIKFLYDDKNVELADSVSIKGYDAQGNEVTLLPPVDPSELSDNLFYVLFMDLVNIFYSIPMLGSLLTLLEILADDFPKSIADNPSEKFKDTNSYDIIPIHLEFQAQVHKIVITVPLKILGDSLIEAHIAYKPYFDVGHITGSVAVIVDQYENNFGCVRRYRGSGGPDSFGYTYIDSHMLGGPVYDWIEISGTGTEILPDSDDDWVANINIGFFFNFYGTDYSQVAIGNNGLVFSGTGTRQYINDPITQSPNIHGFIAPYWDDIVTWGSAGAIYYQTIGTAPNRKFVVEWYNNQHYRYSDEGITFEVILFEGTNNILFQYKDVAFETVYGAVSGDNPPYDLGGSATVGIEDPTGTIGLQYSFNEQVITPGLAILFKFPAFAGTNMHISMSAPASMDRGNTMTYTIHYNNFGNQEALNVVLQATLSPNVDFVSASDGGTYNSGTRTVTWNIGTVPAFPSGRGSRTITVTIPSDVPIGTAIQTTASVSTSTLETRYDDNTASAQTTVTGTSLPPNVNVGPIVGTIGGVPSVYWRTPITFTYYNPTAISVNIRIHLDDGGPDITGSMVGGPPTWTYTVTFYPRTGHATVTYTVNDPTPYSADFDLRNMRGFEGTITAAEIENYIRSVAPNSPMLTETGIGQRFIDAGRNNNVNPAFLVATAQHESVFGTQGWAATHPNAHNAMGWGIYPGHMDEDWEGLDRNAFDSWGDCIAHVAWRIGAPDGPYYGAGHYTVNEVRTVYAGEPAVETIVNYMNALARSAGQAGVFDENFNIYVDPAGYVYDVTTGQRIAGATVWLQRPDGQGEWENVPTGQTPPIMQPDINPQITGPDGQFQWDVLEGTYRVHVEAPGYYPADSTVVVVPPPVTDLHIGLTPIPPPPDNIPPTTILEIGEPKYVDNVGNIYVSSVTPFALNAEDNPDGTSVASTLYRIYNSTYDAGWVEYSGPFYLTGLSDGEYSIDYYSIDNIGNIEPINTAIVILDNTPPITTLTIGKPRYVTCIIYVTPDTPFILEAEDARASINATIYRIYNSTYDSGWIAYTVPFSLTSLTDGTYTIEYYSIDNVQNAEAAQAINVTLFSWNYIFEDTYGRGTILKINLAHKFFQFITPDKDYGIRNATYMRVHKRAIIICHKDSDLKLVTICIDTQLDFCIAYAKDTQTDKIYRLIDK